jgi:hypothetical protein
LLDTQALRFGGSALDADDALDIGLQVCAVQLDLVAESDPADPFSEVSAVRRRCAA